MVFKLRFAWTLLLAPCFFSSAVAEIDAPPTVDLGYAQYQGSVLRYTGNITHTQFLGIRYATPPTGSARFRAPAPPATTSGIRKANAQPPECIQGATGRAHTTPFRVKQSKVTRAAEVGPSEDCLFLNVYIPGTLGERSNLPVVFWIHGGGYAGGGASLFNGNDLIRESGENVIVVVIQYRLGLFGFLPGQKVKDGGDLNAGLLDQQFALQWVQQHISKFGGDPTKVVIWGGSAGAGSVLQHVIANGGRTNPPLFRAAITSTTFLPSQYNYNDRIPETLFNETVARTKCSSSADALECLRKVGVNVLQKANIAISQSGFHGTLVFVPVVDGTFITDRPTALMKGQQLNGKIVLSTTNTHEGVTFVDQTTAPTVKVPTYVSQLFPNFTPQQAQAAAAQYTGLGTRIQQVNAIIGETIFICPTYFLLRAFGGLGYKGEFAVPPGTHGQDRAFVFNNGQPPTFVNSKFDKAFSQSFLNFAMSLDPNIKWDSTDVTPPWPLWNGTNEMLFGRTKAGAADIRAINTSAALLNRCDFWESVGDITAQ